MQCHYTSESLLKALRTLQERKYDILDKFIESRGFINDYDDPKLVHLHREKSVNEQLITAALKRYVSAILN